MEAETLLNLVDASVIQFGGEGLGDLIPEVERVLPTLLRSSKRGDFEVAVNIARLLAMQPNPDQSERCASLLLDVAFAHIPQGRARDGLSLAETAIDLARNCKDVAILRRAHSVIANLLVDIGAPSVAVDHAAEAIRLAESLKDPHAIAAGITSLSSALGMLGLHREVVFLATDALKRFGDDPRCAAPLFALRANFAASAIALQQFPLSARTCEGIVEQMGLPRDANGILNRIFVEGVWLKSAIGMDKADVARARIAVIQSLTTAFRSPRLDLNRLLAEAAFDTYMGNPMLAVAKLLEAKKVTPEFPSLHRECLALLIQTYQKADDQAGALLYLGEFMEFLVKHQIDKVRAQLEALHQAVRTETPGKDDIRSVVLALQREGPGAKSNVDIPIEKLWEMFERLAVSAELREDPTGRHAYRVGRLAGMLATSAGFGGRYAWEIEQAARVHDIGKLAVPDGILMKQAALSDAEYGALMRHVTAGVQILAQCPSTEFQLAQTVVGARHENWDGSGYPRGLKGEDIPLPARIVAIADAYDVMVSPRPFRRAMSHQEAITRILGASGRRFDPKLAALFVDAVDTKHDFMGHEAFMAWLNASADGSPLVRARDTMQRYVAGLAPIEAILEGPTDSDPVDDPVRRV